MNENNSVFFIPGVVGGTFSTTLISKKENYGGDIVDERKQLYFLYTWCDRGDIFHNFTQ